MAILLIATAFSGCVSSPRLPQPPKTPASQSAASQSAANHSVVAETTQGKSPPPAVGQDPRSLPDTAPARSQIPSIPSISPVQRDERVSAKRPWRLDPLPEAIALSREDRMPRVESLVMAALAFSGLEGKELRDQAARILAIARTEAGKVANLTDPARKAEALLHTMHDSWLRRYIEHQSRLDLAFRPGNFNCISSAVMFLILARTAGLEVSGVMTADHAFCLLTVAGGSYDVETTSRHGFDPGSKREFYDAFGKLTGFSYIPSKYAAERTLISARRLVSLILFNRIVESDRQDRFLPSVGPGVDYFTTEKDTESRAFMFTRFTNAIGELSNSAEYRAALEFVTEARSKYGEEPGLDRVARVAVDNWLGELGQVGDWTGGIEVIRSNSGYALSGARSGDFIRAATHNEVLDLVKAKDFSGARRLIASRVESGLIPSAERKRYDDLIGRALYNNTLESPTYTSGMAGLSERETIGAVSAFDLEKAALFLASREAESLSKSLGDLEAWRFLVRVRLSDSEKSRRLLAVYRGNAVADEHNRFVSLYNSKRYFQAADSLELSLKIFPGEPLLTKDRELLAGAVARSGSDSR